MPSRVFFFFFLGWGVSLENVTVSKHEVQQGTVCFALLV